MKLIRKIPWIPLIIIVAIFVFGIVTGRDSASGRIDDLEELASRLDTILTDGNFRGAALVVRDGEVILRAAYGMACDVQGTPNTIYSPFHIASITKNFTGVAILLLELDGKLDTSDTLDNFFTGIDGLENVTVAHLLTMQGGFSDYTNRLLMTDAWAEETFVASVKEIEAYIIENWSGTPQDQPLYCNSDYWLLGRIIEQVSSMSYEEFVARRLFEPAGMANSGFSGIDASVMPHGFPAIYIDGQNLMNPNNWPFFFTYSTGGLISTIDDLNLWLDSYFGGELFPAYLLDDIRVGNYNYGWNFADASIWHHWGDALGFSSHIIYDTDDSTRIILLSNDRSVTPNLVREVSSATIGVPVGGLEIPHGGR